MNSDLINAYSVIKTDIEALIEELSSDRYKNKKEVYYNIRKENPTSNIKKAARFIYLNKTAFNGLYRVNSKGEFNVPFGKYKNPKILDEPNLRLINKALQKDEIACAGFEIVLKNAKKGDLIYFDPPYFPISKTSSFTSYTKGSFSIKEQTNLMKTFKKLDSMGCYVMLSNSYSEFISSLYSEFESEVVYANRMINCKGDRRGQIKELIVRNWESKIIQMNLMEEIAAAN